MMAIKMLRNGSRITKKLGEYSNSLHLIVSAFDFTLYLTCNSIESLSQNMSFRKWLVDGRWTWYCGIAISNHFLQLTPLNSLIFSSFIFQLALVVLVNHAKHHIHRSQCVILNTSTNGSSKCTAMEIAAQERTNAGYPSKLSQPPYHCLSVERDGLVF